MKIKKDKNKNKKKIERSTYLKKKKKSSTFLKSILKNISSSVGF